jgi:menaquinone-specific isochorismate synthase
VGLGETVSLEAASLENLAHLETTAEALLQHCFSAGLDAAARQPRFYGGVTFARAPDPNGPWRNFPRVWFQLPRFRYLTDSKRASLTVLVLAEEVASAQQRHAWVEQTRSTLRSLASAQPASTKPPEIIARQETPDQEAWLRLVMEARESMAKGHLEKVVLAREIALRFTAAPSATVVLGRLGQLAPETTRFALRRGTSTFLGATPERLILRLGSEIRTEALAGSIRATDVGAEEQLLSSNKERYEHHLVVREIIQKLRNLGAKTDYPHRPQVRQLRHVLHLSTPITARLFGPPHILTLATRLHPTPAVGGVPEAQAVDFIKRGEGFERGLYAGAIGWFDAAGDGEFLVALRSGLLEDDTFRLYAGAGIVRDSDPQREFDETQLKFESLLEALGPAAANVSPVGGVEATQT